MEALKDPDVSLIRNAHVLSGGMILRSGEESDGVFGGAGVCELEAGLGEFGFELSGIVLGSAHMLPDEFIAVVEFGAVAESDESDEREAVDKAEDVEDKHRVIPHSRLDR